MAREIISRKDIETLKGTGTEKRNGGTVARGTADLYVDRLIKYIPAEAVACYVFVSGVIARLERAGVRHVIGWSVLVLFCVLTGWYLWRVQKVRKVQQLAISVLSFIVWAFALGGPFTFFPWYDPLYGEILLPLFTFTAAIWSAEK